MVNNNNHRISTKLEQDGLRQANIYFHLACMPLVGYVIHFLMYISFSQLTDGYIVYTYTNSLTPQKFLFDGIAVNDGQWHDFEARWLNSGNLIMLLDFGQRQVCIKWECSHVAH